MTMMNHRHVITLSKHQHRLRKQKQPTLLLTILVLVLNMTNNAATIKAFVIHTNHNPKRTNTVHTTNKATLFAKKKKTIKKKKSGASGGGGGLKGFGGSTSTITSTSSSSATTTGPKIDKSTKALSFYNYIESNERDGNNLKRVALATFPPTNIRGIVALRDIPKGEAILDIPYELALDLGVENSDPTLPAVTLLQKYCSFLNAEDKKEGDGPYMELLPEYRGKDSLSSTDFFTEDALEALQHPLIVEETLNRRQKTKERFESDVLPNIQNFPWTTKTTTTTDGNTTPITVDHLQWAVWLITSRVLTVQTTDTTPAKRLMIPLLDMCNHDRHSPHVLTGRAVPGGRLKVLAGCNVKSGEQIFISYGGGMEGNDRFIQDYGFLDVFGKDEGKVAFELVSVGLVGSSTGGFGRRVSSAAAGGGGGKRIGKIDRERTLEALGETSLEEDEEELKKLKEKGDDDSDDGSLMQMTEALEFRIGAKKALQVLQQ